MKTVWYFNLQNSRYMVTEDYQVFVKINDIPGGSYHPCAEGMTQWVLDEITKPSSMPVWAQKAVSTQLAALATKQK